MPEENTQQQPNCDSGLSDDTSVGGLKSLTDGRKSGDSLSRYPIRSWIQIILELSYLLLLLFAALSLMFLVFRLFVLGEPYTFFPAVFGKFPENKLFLTLVIVMLAGVCGGCATALKWLYHTVAKQHWHQDRIVWRLVVPILAAVLALFLGLMINSGLVPEGKLVDKETVLSNPTTAAAFGFFVGLFSDHALASLQNLALRIFGTIKDKTE